MGAFRFDTDYAEDLYAQAVAGSAEAKELLHVHAIPLFEVIARSVLRDGYEVRDLEQEAHLKLSLILKDDAYDPGRGRLYSYLSVVVRNHLLDILCGKYERSCPSTDDIVPDGGCSFADLSSVSERIVWYVRGRFPKVDAYVLDDIVRYVVDAVVEGVRNQSRGAIRTMCVIHQIDRNMAWSVYWCVVTVLRMEMLGMSWQDNVAVSREATTGVGCLSILPEVYLCMGDNADTLATVFRGSYVKF